MANLICSQCNGERPSCAACTKRHAACVYRAARGANDRLKQLERQLDERNKLIDLLQNLPEHAAADAFRRLRSMSDISAILDTLGGSMHSRYNPSVVRAAWDTAPTTESAVEFELMALNQLAYPTMPPLDIQFLRRFLENSASGAWSAKGDERDENLFSTRGAPTGLGKGTAFGQNTATGNLQSVGAKQILPPLPSIFCDERLHQLDITYWSATPVTNEYAAKLLSSYLERDHAVMGVFDADLFVGDLVACRSRLCSSFLVCAVLYMACVSKVTLILFSLADFTKAAIYCNRCQSCGSLPCLRCRSREILPYRTLVRFCCQCRCALHTFNELHVSSQG